MGPEKGALGSVVSDGAGIPAAQSLGQQHGNSNYHLSQSKGKELLAAESGKDENVSLVDIDEHNSSDSLDQDREKGRFYLDNAQAIASLEGGSDHGDIQRINHTLVPLDVQSLQQRSGLQQGNSSHPQPPVQEKLLVGGAAGAGMGEESENVSRVIEDQCSSDVDILDLDIEKGPSYPYQPPTNDDDSICRICHMNSGAGEIVKLGCACKLDLGQAHRRCANTWFAFRGIWECEICGETVRNMKLLEPMEHDDHHADGVARVKIQTMCARLLLICLVWIAVLYIVVKILGTAFKRTTENEHRTS